MMKNVLFVSAIVCGGCSDPASSNGVCMIYREVDKTISCSPLKANVGSNLTDTAIVRTTDGGSKWCMTTIDNKPLTCVKIHSSITEQEAELADAKAKAEAAVPHDAGVSPDVLGPPFAPRP